VADLRGGGKPASTPLPLGDGLMPSLTVMIANAKFLIVNSTVKHDTRNIENDCHQWLSDSFRVHQISFRMWVCLNPAGGRDG